MYALSYSTSVNDSTMTESIYATEALAAKAAAGLIAEFLAGPSDERTSEDEIEIIGFINTGRYYEAFAAWVNLGFNYSNFHFSLENADLPAESTVSVITEVAEPKKIKQSLCWS